MHDKLHTRVLCLMFFVTRAQVSPTNFSSHILGGGRRKRGGLKWVWAEANKIPYHYHNHAETLLPTPSPPSLSQLENPGKGGVGGGKKRRKKANEYVEFSHVNCVRILI